MPEWAIGGRREGIFGRRGLIFMTQNKYLLVVLIIMLIGTLVWHNYHIVPNPVTLLTKQPSTTLSSLSNPDDWAMLGEDFNRTRYIPNPPQVPHGRLLWSSEPGFLRGISLPSIVDDNLYVGSYFNLYNIDANTGKILWEKNMSGLVNSSPTVAGDHVYVGSTDTTFWALDRFTGKTKWTFRTGNYISSSALVSNGRLFVGSGDHYMYALDAATGKMLWKFRTDDLITSAPSLKDNVLYFTSNDKSLYSVDSRTGQARMRFRTRGTSNFEPAVVANGLVYIASASGILTAKAGIREIPARWQFEKTWRLLWLRWGWPIPRPTAQHGTSWRFNPENYRSISSAPAVTEDEIYVGDSGGYLYSRDALDSSEIWTFQAEGGIKAAPLVAGDFVYFGTNNGTFYALDRHSGKESWKIKLGSPILLSHSMSGGKIFVRTDNGQLHAIE